jgi:LysM repeat protein
MTPVKCPFATQKISNKGTGAFIGVPWRIVWHTTEGSTIEGAFAILTHNHDESHFLVDGRQIWQLTPLNVASRALRHVGSPETNRANALQVELVGFAGRPKPQDLLIMARKLSLWLHGEFQIPFVWPNGYPKPPRNGQDPGGHNRDPIVWAAKGGDYSHGEVPGNIHWDTAFTKAEADFIVPPSGAVSVSVPGKTYTVAKGDTLSSIARQAATTAKVLAALNAIANPSNIKPGQIINLPA